MASGFSSHEEVFREPGRNVRVFLCPSVATIGWIPFYSDLNQIQHSAIGTYPIGRTPSFNPHGLGALFWSGNRTDIASQNPAAAAFSSRAQFQALISSKNFRAAAALDDIRVVWDEEGPVSVKLAYFGAVGYTPMRSIFGSTVTLFFDRGRGGSLPPKAEHAMNSVLIRHTVRFKIGRIGDFGSYLFTGRFAPSCAFETQYRIHEDGTVDVAFAGACIPNQSYYVNWNRSGIHDMLSDTVDQYALAEFFNAGACKDAPVKIRETRREIATVSF